MPIQPGYKKNFLGNALSMPKLDTNLLAPRIDGKGMEINYTHFSIFLHQDRRLPLLAAVNIKGEAYNSPPREGNEPWDFSDQVAQEYQIDNGFYGKDENTFDRGHIVRRVDPAWGDDMTASQAEQDTFRWVNCTPQHKKLNQKGGVWFQLEQHVIENGVKGKIANVSVFAGPVLDPKDLPFKKKYRDSLVKVPISFWKVIVWKKSNGKLYAVGFMMSQWEFIKDKLIKPVKGVKAKEQLPDDHFENLKFNDHKTYQVPLSAIEKATGIKFSWKNVSFPYKAAKPKIVKAVPLKQVRSFREIFETRKKETTLKKLSAVKDTFKKAAPLAKKKVKDIVGKREGYLLKQFKLTNVSL